MTYPSSPRGSAILFAAVFVACCCVFGNAAALDRCPRGLAAGAAPCTLSIEANDLRRTHDTSPYFEISGNVLLVLTRAGERPQLCCDFIVPLEPVADGLWGIKIFIPHLGRNRMLVGVIPDGRVQEVRRGRAAAPIPTDNGNLNVISGELDFDREGAAPRQTWRFRPPSCDERACPRFLLADGEGFAPYVRVAQDLMHRGRIRPVEIIAIASAPYDLARNGRMQRRSLEYLPGAEGGAAYFDEHFEAFWA